MPFPIAISLALFFGLLASVASRAELRIRPRSALLTRGYAAFMVFMVFLFLPSVFYFFLFYGDWFLLYLTDASQVPSAVVLVSFIALLLLGTGAFALGAQLARARRDILAVSLVFGSLVLGGAALVPFWDRLGIVGSVLQYRAASGGEPFAKSPLVFGMILVLGLLSVGKSYLVVQLVRTGRRA